VRANAIRHAAENLGFDGNRPQPEMIGSLNEASFRCLSIERGETAKIVGGQRDFFRCERD